MVRLPKLLPSLVFLICALRVDCRAADDRQYPPISGKVYLSDLNLRFREYRWKGEGLPDGDMEIADLNGDGKDDLFSVSNSLFRAALSNGSGTFEPLTPFPVGQACKGRAAGGLDLEGDGGKDALLIADGESRFCVIRYKHGAFDVVGPKPAPQPDDEGILGPPGNVSPMFMHEDSSGERTLHRSTAEGHIFRWSVESSGERLRYQGKTHLGQPSRAIGAGNFRDAAQQEIAVTSEGIDAFFVELCERLGSTCRGWLHFPGVLKNAQPFIGDFNADGRTDVLLIGSPLHGAWIGIGTEVTGVEREVAGLHLEPHQIRSLRVGDFDGNGADDLLIRTPQSAELLVFSADLGTPLPGVKIGLDGGQETTTAADGSFHFDARSERAHRLTGRLREGFEISRRVSSRRSQLNLITDTTEGMETKNGQAFGLHGFFEGPAVCTGYVPPTQDYHAKWSPTQSCPQGYIYSSLHVVLEPRFLAWLFSAPSDDARVIAGNCCKLPFRDMLTGDHSLAQSECPADTVATGYRMCESCTERLICTRINTRRYRLGSKVGGRLWGVNAGVVNTPRLLRNDIPAALRESVGRFSQFSWSIVGCVGAPWGSALVSESSNHCDRVSFRPFLYQGLPGDPVSGTEVPILPPCEHITDAFDPLARCAE